MSNELEYLKRLNMVEILSSYYNLQFTHKGSADVCLSPFTNESVASFFVRPGSDGHWLFKDFSSGHGGSIIDFILLKENISEVSQAAAHLRKILSHNGNLGISEPLPAASLAQPKRYDIHRLYQQIKRNDPAVCRRYLSARGIGEEFIIALEQEGILLHNSYKDDSYCSFAVYDAAKRLSCIDNHQINGSKKFVLGKKHIFSLDWPDLKNGSKVYICESIIDYLSIKTLEGGFANGIALLGNQLTSYDLSFLNNSSSLVSCFDNDGGGFRGYLDLREQFPDKEVSIYELGPAQKDVNDRLLSERQAKRATHLSAEDKLALYKAFIRTDNRSQLAQDWGIDRSYLYKIVKECEQTLLDNFNEKSPGRKSADEVANKPEAKDKIKKLEGEKQKLAKEKELYYAQGEFLKLRLKWSERELSELQGEAADGDAPKRQIKKKSRKKR